MGMSIAHGVAAGMGGIRAAGDLVARMQMARKMRIHEAKAYVAEKLKISPFDLSDPHVMREVREELDIGIITSVPGCAKGIEAKARIAQLLDIDIASVNRLKEKMKF
jgi:dimethylamine--corrinoid protein Co-methyltransferase